MAGSLPPSRPSSAGPAPNSYFKTTAPLPPPTTFSQTTPPPLRACCSWSCSLCRPRGRAASARGFCPAAPGCLQGPVTGWLRAGAQSTRMDCGKERKSLLFAEEEIGGLRSAGHCAGGRGGVQAQADTKAWCVALDPAGGAGRVFSGGSRGKLPVRCRGGENSQMH